MGTKLGLKLNLIIWKAVTTDQVGQHSWRLLWMCKKYTGKNHHQSPLLQSNLSFTQTPCRWGVRAGGRLLCRDHVKERLFLINFWSPNKALSFNQNSSFEPPLFLKVDLGCLALTRDLTAEYTIPRHILTRYHCWSPHQKLLGKRILAMWVSIFKQGLDAYKFALPTKSE